MSLYDGWEALNDSFIYGLNDEDFLLAGRELPTSREFSYVTYAQHMSGMGWGLPDYTPLFNHEKRVNLLTKRYIDHTLWDEAMNRLDLKKNRLGGPMAYVFPFHREASSVPTGGGCLVSLILTWFDKNWKIHILSRASEITVRLLGDMYFMRSCVDGILEKIPLKYWPENPQIDWTLLLCSQMKHVIPYYLLITKGEDFIRKLMCTNIDLDDEFPWKMNLRIGGLINYFWESTIFPETISWQQRRKWSDRFMAEAQLPWVELRQRHLKKIRYVRVNFNKMPP